MIAESRLLGWLALIAAGWILYLLAPILTPFLASGLLAYLGDPLVDRFERLRLPRTLAVLVVFLLMFLSLSALVVLIFPLASAQIVTLVDKLPDYVDWLESRFLPTVMGYLGVDESDPDLGLAAFLSRFGGELGGFASGAVATVSRTGTAFVAGLVSLFLIPVITFYLLRDWDMLMTRIAALIPDEHRARGLSLARQSDQVLGGFLRGQLMVMLALTFIYCVGLYLVGLDFALAIGVVAGLVSFVPYLGLIVGIALAGLAAMAQLQSFAALAGVVAVFVVGQLIEGTLLTPKLVGDRIGLHPVLVIFAVLAGGQLFGFFGVLLALPAAAVASVLVRFAYQHYREVRKRPAAEGAEST